MGGAVSEENCTQEPCRVFVYLPSGVRGGNGSGCLEVHARTVREALDFVADSHPGVAAKLFDSKDQLRSFVRVFINEMDLRMAGGLDGPLSNGAEIRLITAIAGG
jgi:hypothetical protein